MQSFIATCGMEPLHMVSPASEDPRRIEEFPAQLLDALQVLAERGIRPRDIVTPASLRNATLVAIAMGGSTNVVLHAPELARAAGHRLLARGDQPGGIQRGLAHAAGAGQRPPVRPLLDGRHRRQGRPAGDRPRAARRRAARRRLHHLHRRDAGRAGRPAGPARAGRRGDPPAVRAVQADRRPAAAPRQPGPRRRRGDQARRRRGRHGRRPVHRARPRLRQRGGADRGAGVRRRSRSRTATWW